MTRFIAVDPASTITGWAVFQDGGLVSWGVIDARSVVYSFRPQFIINELIEVARRYGFIEVAVEMAPRFEGREIAILQVIVSSIKHWAKSMGLPYQAYNVSSWKKAAVANSRADKQEVRASILLRFPRLPVNLTEHEYDAIGIGILHAGLQRWQHLASKGGS